MPVITTRKTNITIPTTGTVRPGRVAFKKPHIDPRNHIKSTNDLAAATEDAINKLSRSIEDQIAAIPAPVSSGGGVLVAQKSIATGAFLSTATKVVWSDAIPTGAQGLEILKISYAATSALNRIRLSARIMVSGGGNSFSCGFINKDAGNAIASSMVGQDGGVNYGRTICVDWEGVAGDTASHDYRIRCGPDSIAGGTLYVNGTQFGGPGRIFGGTASSYFELMELTP